MKHAATQQLYSYWNELRGERASPERGEVDPAAIRGVLADTFILEVDPERRFPFRLSGTRLNALFTRDLKGLSFPALFRHTDRPDIVEVLAGICDDIIPVVAGISAAPAGRSAIDLELLLLPVRHLGKTHSRILGSLSPAALPSWIGLLPLEILTLNALRVLSGPTLAQTSAAAAVDPPTARLDVRCPPHSRARHGHLFVHDGGVRTRNPAS